jgi:uncharacterized protein (TIRG00374 family)
LLQKLKKILITASKIFATGYLVYYLAYKINWLQVRDSLLHAQVVFLFIAFFGYLIKLFLEALKWKILNGIFDIDLNIWDLYQYKIAGPAFDFITPLPQGEDIYKFYVMKKNEATTSTSVFVPVLFKWSGLVATLTVLPFGVAYYISLVRFEQITKLFYPMLAGLVLLGVLLVSRHSIFSWLQKKQHENPQSLYAKLLSGLHHIKSLLQLMREHPKALVQGVTMSYVVHATYALVFWSIMQSLHVQLPYYVMFISIPFVFFMAILPLTVGGVGLKEGALVWILLYHHVSQPVAQSVGALHLLLMLTLVLIGFVFLWKNS